MNEVNAQKARAVIDLLIGYKLSPCLWANIVTQEKGLSSGRVQSALLKLLFNREKEIKEYEPEYSFDIQGKFKDLEKSEFIFDNKSLSDDIDIDEVFEADIPRDIDGERLLDENGQLIEGLKRDLNGVSDLKSVGMSQITTALIKAVQELNAKVDALGVDNA